MEKRLGVIAGSGDSPAYIRNEAQRQGFRCVTAAVRGEADPVLLEEGADALAWFHVTEARSLVRFFKDHGITEAVFAGKISPRFLFEAEIPGPLERRPREGGDDRSPSAVIETAMDYLRAEGITVISPKPFLSPLLCDEGILSRTHPSSAVEADVTWGWERARLLADADIGQCLVVKHGAVAAVEGAEGTDACIRRGGELAGPGFVAVKVARTRQDFRLDLPAVGLATVQAMIEAGGAALCFEAGVMPFFRKNEALALADGHRLVVQARR